MSVLAIETATAVCSVALVKNGEAIIERSVEAHYMHSEKLMVLIDEAMTVSGESLTSVEGVAVSIGPGSFTGLRIGLSTAKGLVYASNKTLVAVPTLEGLAYNALHQNAIQNGDCILAMIDARRNEVYAAAYIVTDNLLREHFSSRALSVDEIVSLLPHDRRVIIVGDGAEKFQQHIKEQHPAIAGGCLFPPHEKRQCSAVAIGCLGEQKLARGEHADIASLEPLYVKEFYTTMQVM